MLMFASELITFPAELKRLDATLQDLEEKQNSKKRSDFQGTTKNSVAAGWKRQGPNMPEFGQASTINHLIGLGTNFCPLYFRF
ncbi:hypothetical protein PHJA_002917400 [Phtheirospermum japonicum]|uniref:Uncharacterized protein n=1 Tax=Phtheirospermum japonicum TaxID=374723 RepID=A0A830DJE8_9LAMI|nr:hypothetical protein PHJA_002917400 [Phtheirospermum japonicum]